jgi:retrograde regulation protein 2
MDSALDGYEIAAAQTGESLPFGAAKMIRILESGDVNVQTTARTDLHAGMRRAFLQLQQRFPSLKAVEEDPNHEGVDIYLCGGGLRGYGSMLMHNDPIQPYPIPTIGAYTVSGSYFSQVETMRRFNREYDSKIHGMSKRRRKQFPAIAEVVESIIATIPKIHTVTFCSGGNREGALLMKLPREIREANPLSLLHQHGNGMSETVMGSVITTIQSAVPKDLDLSDTSTIFTLGLGPLFACNIWTCCGEPSDANAAHGLHQAISRDPSAPGLTHLARAVWGLTSCARWDSNLGPVDKELYRGLRKLVSAHSDEAAFVSTFGNPSSISDQSPVYIPLSLGSLLMAREANFFSITKPDQEFYIDN